MKKLLTILALAALLCLVCGAAMADVQYKNVYVEGDELPAANGTILIGGEECDVVQVVPEFATLVGHNTMHTNKVSITYRLPVSGQEKTVIVSYMSDPHSYDLSKKNGKLDPDTAKQNEKYAGGKDSTCTTKGYDIYICDDCNYQLKVERALADHTFEKQFASTDCSKGGENKMVCTACGKVQDGTTEVVGPTAHAFDEYNPKCYKVISVPACYKGSKGEVKLGKAQMLCKYCGKAINPDMEADDYFYMPLDAYHYSIIIGKDYDGHNWDEWVHYDQDCFACERQIRWCKTCGVNETEYWGDPTDTKLPEFNKASIQHKDGNALTCAVDPGDLVLVCKNCGGEVDGHILDATNTKSFTNGVGAKVELDELDVDTDEFYAYFEVTYTYADGSTDGDYNYKDLPHVYTYTNDTRLQNAEGKAIGEKAATCTSGAYTEYCCVNDASYKQDEITHPTSKKYNAEKPAKGHVWDAWITVVAPNAQKNVEGYWIRNCTVCGLQEDAHGKEIPCTGDAHTWVVKETKPATKEADGSQTLECSVCGAKKTKVLKYTPSADPKYEVKDAVYDGEAVSGKVNHVDDTKELTAAYARVTFFYADGTFAVMVVPVEDGEFYAGATTATVHVAVQIVDNAKQITPPATDAIYGNAAAEMK